MSRLAAHRRTRQAWERMSGDLYAAQRDVLETEHALTKERRLRKQADALMGRLVTRAEEAEARAAAAESALTVERERMRQAGELIAGLRQQLAGPKPPPSEHETQEIPQPTAVRLGSPPRQVVVRLGTPPWHAPLAS